MRRTIAILAAPAAIVGIMLLAEPHPSAQASSVDAVLAKAAAYLADFERRAAAVVAEEDYVQTSGAPATVRRLRSDILLDPDAEVGWVGFRDVLDVDGRTVRDHDERLSKLLQSPAADRLVQARRISDEGARYNLNGGRVAFKRTINVPFVALRFLRLANQSRSKFALGGSRAKDGVRQLEVRFREQREPRIIATSDGAAAEGQFWIEAESGRIYSNELRLTTKYDGQGQTGLLSTTVRVEFALDPKLRLCLPAVMDDEYSAQITVDSVPTSQGVRGHAQYSKFRTFAVDVVEKGLFRP